MDDLKKHMKTLIIVQHVQYCFLFKLQVSYKPTTVQKVYIIFFIESYFSLCIYCMKQ